MIALGACRNFAGLFAAEGPNAKLGLKDNLTVGCNGLGGHDHCEAALGQAHCLLDNDTRIALPVASCHGSKG